MRPSVSWRFPFLGGLFGRHEMPPLQLHNDPGFLLSQPEVRMTALEMTEGRSPARRRHEVAPEAGAFFPLALWDPSSVVAASHAAFRRPFPLFRSRALECRLRPLFCSGGISCRLPLPYLPPPRSRAIPGQSQGHASWRCPFLCRLFGRHEMPPLQLRGTGGMRCRPYNCTTTLDSAKNAGMTDMRARTTTLDSRSGISEHIQG